MHLYHPSVRTRHPQGDQLDQLEDHTLSLTPEKCRSFPDAEPMLSVMTVGDKGGGEPN